MARYWMYLEGHVEGPYGVEQIIRQKGFSRQTLVCVEDASGKPQHWISPADIPELAHIFKAIDDKAAEVPAAPRPSVKRDPRPQRVYTPAVMLKRPSSINAVFWGWMMLAVLLLGGGTVAWFMQNGRTAEKMAQQEVRRLIENVHLSGPYGSLAQYIQQKSIVPRWDIEKKFKGLYNATVSWYAEGKGAGEAHTLYAFEVNTQAQTVRALNSAAAKLLSGSLASSQKAPAADKPPAEKKSKSPPSFDRSLESYMASLTAGDFPSIWSNFSKRKKAEMASGGISRDGFIRLQSLTHKLEAGAQTTLVKTKEESPAERLVLLKQSPPGQPETFIKQLWITEDGAWKLDDEQKRSAGAPEAEEAPVPKTNAPTPAVPPHAPASLPGMSN